LSFTKKKKVFLSIGFIIGVLLMTLRLFPYGGLDQFEKSFYSIPIYSDQKNLLAILPLENGMRRQFLSLENFPDELKEIILQSEDGRFYFHPGFDLPALMRASFQYFRTGEIDSGASTITMQLTRMIHPRIKGIGGKFLEIFNAVRLEVRFSKREILEAYINHLPFGSNLEGIESAAYYFFGKEARSLSKEELLILMMVPRRPEDYNPFVNPGENRRALMRTIPRIKKEISFVAVDQVYENLSFFSPAWPSEAPHFIQMIQSQISEAMWQSGAPLFSSLNEDFQKGAQSYLENILNKTKNNRISNGAVLAIDNESGQILAYVGSVNFYNDEIQGQIDGVRILRQPGSTLKPFLYGKAIESGFNPSTPLPDIPLEFGNREVYIPENYNERFNGPVRLSVALGSSLNVPAVYLLERLGVKPFLKKLVSSGFESLRGKENLGVGLALGNGEISLWELVQGFSIFSRRGEFLPISFDKNREKPSAENVFAPEVSEMIRNILSNKQNRVLGFGRSSPLDVSFDACFKTGTSNQFNNIWALGSSQDMTVGVWMGNFSGETVIGSPGSSYPARIVVSLLEEFHKTDEFNNTIEFVKREICSLSGDLAGPECTYTIEEMFSPLERLKTCRWHRGGLVYLPADYSRWSSLYRQDYEIDSDQSELEILQPGDGSLFYLDPTLPEDSQALVIRISGRNKVYLYINDRLVHEGNPPVTFFQNVEKGRFTIRAEDGSHIKEAIILVK
jgi:penicillin-binding protein 1C